MEPSPPPEASPPADQPQQPQNGLGVSAMVLGVVSIPTCFCWGLGGLVGAAGAVLGFLGKQKVDRGVATNRRTALAGIITGVAGAVLGIGFWVLVASGMGVELSGVGPNDE